MRKPIIQSYLYTAPHKKNVEKKENKTYKPINNKKKSRTKTNDSTQLSKVNNAVINPHVKEVLVNPYSQKSKSEYSFNLPKTQGKITTKKITKASPLKFDPSELLEKLRDNINSDIIANELVERQKFKSISIMNAQPDSVPHSKTKKIIDAVKNGAKKRLLTKTIYGNVITYKDDDGNCTEVTGFNFMSTRRYRCGMNKFDKSFSRHMKKVTDKFNKHIKR